MKTRTILITVTLASSMAVAAFAHKNVTGIIKERMDGMMAMGKALGSVADMFKGKTKYDAAKVGSAAEIVLGHAVNIDKLFPDTKASREGKGSDALPVVWEKRDVFLAMAKELEKRAGELKTVSATGDEKAVRMSFGKLAKTCGTCHTDYRKPKQ